MSLISNPGDWFTVGHNIDTHRVTLSISPRVSWIIEAFADTNDEVKVP